MRLIPHILFLPPSVCVILLNLVNFPAERKGQCNLEFDHQLVARSNKS
jgi:hypothetical protein